MKKKVGRPISIKRTITSTTQEGLPEGWTRATFIVREEYLDKIRALALGEKKIKDIVDEALSDFLKDRNE